MYKVEFVVYGEPKGKARPRFNSRTKRVYTPKTTTSYESEVRKAYRSQFERMKTGKPVDVEIDCYCKIPGSWSKKKKEQALNGEIKPTSKPDVDNVAKTILDALNGLAYHDDKQVVSLTIKKKYDNTAYAAVRIKESE